MSDIKAAARSLKMVDVIGPRPCWFEGAAQLKQLHAKLQHLQSLASKHSGSLAKVCVTRLFFEPSEPSESPPELGAPRKFVSKPVTIKVGTEDEEQWNFQLSWKSGTMTMSAAPQADGMKKALTVDVHAVGPSPVVLRMQYAFPEACPNPVQGIGFCSLSKAEAFESHLSAEGTGLLCAVCVRDTYTSPTVRLQNIQLLNALSLDP